jgi:signal transduction histidine kinase/AraC-like DNA-binding protein/ABC-type sugar transport system substrate-binding protein
MAYPLRIGTQIWPDDPFWVQVREAIHLRAEQLGVTLVPIEREALERLALEPQLGVLEEVLALDLHALIGWSLDDALVLDVLAANVPVIHLGESALRHPRFCSPHGLYAIAHELGRFVAARVADPGPVLLVGGGQGHGEDGRSRVAGFRAALADRPDLSIVHIPAPWRYEQAYPHIVAALADLPTPPVAICGLSDSLALAARDVLRERGDPTPARIVVGVNGDPLALAAIAEGTLTATMLTSAVAFGAQAFDLAIQAARGAALPEHFSFAPLLVTAENVIAVAAQQHFATAPLTNRLVGFNRQQEQRRLSQLETSLAISRRAGVIMERQQLAHLIADVIRSSYGYAEVQLLRWDAEAQTLRREPADAQQRGAPIVVERSPVLEAALSRNQPVFLPDVRRSRRFAVDPTYLDLRARVVVPIRLGGQITGLLDLHRYEPIQHTQHDLIGLQILADQLGIAVRNAELYEQALAAQRRAEQADELKMRLLANVSHELRTPLNLVLGYSQAATAALAAPGGADLGLLARDMGHIRQSVEHLIRLINDLLDLSRASIGALELFPEPIAPRRFLTEIVHAFADREEPQSAVAWRLDLPARLPAIHADPTRLRQVLLNVLSNARKFTTQGAITLGADVQVPYLHIWVRDTGAGIAPECQERIFESFVSEPGVERRAGIGLGLTIARELVSLHGGSITLDSRVGAGSTFHIYLPLPNLSGRPLPPLVTDQPALLLIAADGEPQPLIDALCRRQGLRLRHLRVHADLVRALAETQPVALAWNLAASAAPAWELFQQIRSRPQLFDLPLLLYYQQADAAQEANSGLTSVLLKPLAATQLVAAIERVRPHTLEGAILIVDDDEAAHTLYRQLIAAELPGYPVRSAYSGREALALLGGEPPSLMILDLTMPDVDGFAVLEALRAHAPTRTVPVLVISGRMLTPEDIQRLDGAYVTLQSKAVLSDAETAAAIRRALAPHERSPQQTGSLVKHAVAYIHQNYRAPLTRQEIADAIGVNKDYLSRIFRRELGLSPWEYLNRYRVGRAKELLRSTHTSIAAIAAEVGFPDPAYFSRVFQKEAGCSPRAYRDVAE